jgi:hypothetical protein
LQEHDPNDHPLAATQNFIHREGNRTGGVTLDFHIISRRQSK